MLSPMTVIPETPRISYVGDGTTAAFATGFTFELALELTVWRGAPTYEDCCEAPAYADLYALNVDYTIDAGDWLEDGGTVRFAAHAIPAADQLVTIMRTTPPDQPEAFGDHETFQPEQHEFTLDRITRMIQELYHNPLGFLLLGGLAYDWKFYAPDAWTDETPIDVLNVVRGLTFPADFLGSIATVESYPAAPVTLSIQDQDDAEVGTMAIPTSGAITFTTTNPAGFSKAFGAQLRIVPPAGGLGAATGLSATLVATVV